MKMEVYIRNRIVWNLHTLISKTFI